MTRRITWDETQFGAKQIALRALEVFEPINVYGIPRGGVPVALMVADRLHVDIAEQPGTDTLVVDDIVDSGATLAPFLEHGWVVDALYRTERAPSQLAPAAEQTDDWLHFPWEPPDETGPHDAVIRILEYIGEDPKRPGLIDTPRRVIEAFAEMTEGYRVDVAAILGVTFEDACDEMVLLREVEFTSLCEHHLLPFSGTVSIGYVPTDRVVGLSKLARLVDAFARRLQVQERMTEQIATALADHVDAAGVGVIVRAVHSCMACRGVRKTAQMVTSSMLGVMREDPRARAEFLALTRGSDLG